MKEVVFFADMKWALPLLLAAIMLGCLLPPVACEGDGSIGVLYVGCMSRVDHTG